MDGYQRTREMCMRLVTLNYCVNYLVNMLSTLCILSWVVSFLVDERQFENIVLISWKKCVSTLCILMLGCLLQNEWVTIWKYSVFLHEICETGEPSEGRLERKRASGLFEFGWLLHFKHQLTYSLLTACLFLSYFFFHSSRLFLKPDVCLTNPLTAHPCLMKFSKWANIMWLMKWYVC